MSGRMALEAIEKSVEKSRYVVRSDRVFWQSSKTLPEFMTHLPKYQIVFCCQQSLKLQILFICKSREKPIDIY